MTGFIFDMDGCLLDSIGIWHEAEQHILDMVHVELTKEQRDELNALTLEEAGVWFHEQFGILGDGSQVAQAIIDYMLEFYRHAVQPKPGAVEFVRALHEAGSPLCVLSSSPQAFLQAGLGHTGLKPFFPDELIISADKTGLTKRKSSTFECVCGKLGCELADAWLFDDSWYACRTAHEAGLHVAGTFSSDQCGTHDELARYSDLVIDDFAGLSAGDFLK